MLFLALILADQLDEAERNPPGGVSPVLLDNLADRLEAVALALEEPAPNA
jgi:cell division protein ZapA